MSSIGCFLGAFALTIELMSWRAPSSLVLDDASLSLPAEADHGRVSLVYDGVQAMDQYKYFHNQDGIMDSAKTAEVLFLGNSRMLCGLDQKVLEEFFGATGTSFYHLGFGYDEGSEFPLSLIERFDLKPKIVVVGCDPSFWGAVSEATLRVRSDSRWHGWTEVFEFDVAWRLRRVLHRWVPKIVAQEKIAIWRRHEDGFWVVRTRETKRIGVSYQEGQEMALRNSSHLDSARSFLSELRRGGATLVLTVVPSNESSLAFARQMASLLGVPLILANPELEYTTFDGDHLDEESSTRFTRSFIEGFAGLDLLAP